MDMELPTEFDVIVIGTGMTESMVAAAASRIGKSVLHIDSNEYYGSAWAALSYEQLFCSVKEGGETPKDNVDIERFVAEGEKFLQVKPCGIGSKLPSAVHNTSNDDIKNELLKHSRKFNIDLAPKLQYARGDFVELLISSNIARYCEFRTVSRILTWVDGHIEVVPCSRSDVFSNPKVSIREKRLLMKLMETCIKDDEKEFEGYENKNFLAYLEDHHLTPNLIHFVLYAIARGTKETSCKEGFDNTRRFLNSLGRFGKTPFLYCMYGAGELSQAFCRLCAVFGGVYCLNRQIDGIVLNSENKFSGIVCNNQRISAKQLVIGADYAPGEFFNNDFPKAEYINHAIFITTKSILHSEDENLSLLLYPPEDTRGPIVVIETGPATGCCPQGYHVVHMFCKNVHGHEKDFEHCINNLLHVKTNPEEEDDDRPTVLCHRFYTVADTSSLDLKVPNMDNVHLCSGPDSDLDFDFSIKQARSVFADMCPDCEFLPRAPDPEEIIIEGEEAVEEKSESPEETEKESPKSDAVEEAVESVNNPSTEDP